MVEVGKLTKAQRDWLSAFKDGPPVEMGWLDAEHCPATGAPETWIWLEACWPDGRTARLHTDDRAGLEPFFAPNKWCLTDLGRQALLAGER